MERSASERLACAVHDVQFDRLPAADLHHAKRFVLDTLGCALGACGCEPGRAAQAVAGVLGGRERASLIGAGSRTSAPLATLVNGTLVRYLDSNDYYFGADSAHPSSNIAPALALAQAYGRSGRDLLGSVVIGYEVHMRLCDAIAPPGVSGRGWHTATHVQFATAALAARLLQDDPAVTANALAIAGSHHCTLAEAQRGAIPLMKATAEAYVAKGAVEAALLAAEGLTGPRLVFEGSAGWASALGIEIDQNVLTARIGDDLRIGRSCIKPYPVVAGATAPVQAALDLAIPPELVDEIREVVVTLPRVTARKATGDPGKLRPTDKETADHSIHYCVAVALRDGACGHEQFSDAAIASPGVASLIDRIRIEEDAELTELYPSSSGGGVEVRLRDGRRFARTHRYPPGHAVNPVSDGDLERKFFEMSHNVLSRGRAQRAIDRIWALDASDTVDAMMDELKADVS